MKKQTKEGLEIEFIEKIRHPGYYAYKVKLTNKSNKNIKYNMENLRCNVGDNVLLINKYYTINGIALLDNGNLKKSESIEKLVCFRPSGNFSTDSPVFYYDGETIKVKFKIKKKSKAEVI